MFHYWRVIGHCLGIEDQFNLCAGTDEETFEFCRQCYYEDWLPRIKQGETTGMAMANGIALAMHRFVPGATFNAMLRYGAPAFGLDKSRYPLNGFWDYTSYLTIWATMKIYSRSSVIMWIASCLLAVALRLSIWFRSFHEWSLRRKYVGAKYEYNTDERCPFEIKANYKTAFELKLH